MLYTVESFSKNFPKVSAQKPHEEVRSNWGRRKISLLFHASRIPRLVVGDVSKAYCRRRIYAILSVFLLAEIRSSMPPMINEKVVYMSTRLKDTIVIPCVAYGNPTPANR